MLSAVSRGAASRAAFARGGLAGGAGDAFAFWAERVTCGVGTMTGADVALYAPSKRAACSAEVSEEARRFRPRPVSTSELKSVPARAGSIGGRMGQVRVGAWRSWHARSGAGQHSVALVAP